MSIGPLRRLVGILGLVALVPVLLMVGLGEIGLVDAAVRASVTVVTLLLLGRVVGWAMSTLAAQAEATSPPTPGGRRSDDPES